MPRQGSRSTAFLRGGLTVLLLLVALSGCRLAPFDMAASIQAIDGNNDDAPPPGPFLLTFNGNTNDSGSPPAATQYMYGDSITIPGNTGGLAKTTPSVHTFVGWNTSDDGTGTNYVSGDTFVMPAAPVILYANWTIAATYTVGYTALNADSGSPPVDPNDYLETATVTVQGPGSLVRAGYNLTGWTDGTNTYPATTGTFSMPAMDVTLDPVWTPAYTVNYTATGADSGTPPTDSTQYIAGATVTVLGNPGGLDQSAGTWIGWNDGSNTYIAGQTFVMPAGNVTLDPVFSPDPTYTVTYTGLNADSGSPPTDSNNYLETATVTVQGAGSLLRSGYTLTGWNDGTNTYPVSTGSFAMPPNNVTLDPVWTLLPTHTISFNAGGATGTLPAPITDVAGAAITIPNGSGLTNLGHVFTGWNTQADGGGTAYPAGVATMPGSDITLYAQWDLDISGGGSGTVIDPYVIMTADDLNNVRYDLDANYIVGADIDLSVGPYGSGLGWTPIGTNAAPFTGTFDGGYDDDAGTYYIISNLYINQVINSSDGTGLFGRTNGAVITHTALENISITGGDTVGGLVGWPSTSTLSQSYVTGTISAGQWIGGLIGYTNTADSISETFTDVTVSGSSSVGGLIGTLHSTATVADSYAVGSTSGASVVGGLAGSMAGDVSTSYVAGPVSGGNSIAGSAGGTATDVFYDSDQTGTTGGVGIELSGAGAVAQASYAGFAFGTVWNINEGASWPFHTWYSGPAPVPTYQITYNANGGSSPPLPSAELPAGDSVTISGPGAMTNGSLTFTGWNTQADGLGTGYNPSDVVTMPVGGMPLYAQWAVIFAGGGSGTAMDPYVVMSPDDLNNVREDLAAHYRLGADIDMNVSPYNSGPGFEPIGDAGTKFTGSFNGETFTIHNLYMSRGVTGTGLFGRIEGASLTSVRLLNVNINNTGNNTGAIVGGADGTGNTLTNSFVTGTIDSNGGYNVGAVVGYAYQISVLNTFADATVSANSNGAVGGLIGRINAGGGTIQQTYFRGSVTGSVNDEVGGLVGVSSADVMDSYVSATIVAPGTTKGGIVAQNGGVVSDSFYDSDVAPIPDNGDGVPRTTIEMQTLANFIGIWDFASTWTMTDGATYPYFQTQPSGIGSKPP